MTKRTTEEILGRVEKLKEEDFFGFQTQDLVVYLDYDAARPFLADGATSAQWNADTAEWRNGHRTPLTEITDYLPFAWEKANNRRGLSSMRSLEHMKSWLWLAGVDDLSFIDGYESYGKRQLVAISLAVGFDWVGHDDGLWVNSESGHALDTPQLGEEVERATDIAAKLREALS